MYTHLKIGKVVWLYLGCPFHDCKVCFKNRHEHFMELTYEQRYRKTFSQIRWYKEACFQVVYEWNCTFTRILSHSQSLTKFSKKFGNINFHLEPRKEVTGGRVECFCLFYSTENSKNETIRNLGNSYFNNNILLSVV